MSDTLCVHRDRRVLWGNQAFLRQLGRARVEDVVGLDILHDIVHPDDRAELARTMRLPATSTGLTSRRFRVHRPDDTEIIIEISEPQIVEFDGSPARLVVGRDITESRRQESATVVADRMASIGMLAAGVAHEVNNPLAYVHANLVLAERGLAKGGSLALREAIAAKIRDVGAALGIEVKIEIIEEPRAAIVTARENLLADEMLCVSGSVYLAGIARKTLRERRARDVRIELATADRLGEIPDVERRASALFSPLDLPPEAAADTFSLRELEAAQKLGRLIVALDVEGRVVGFALLDDLDDGIHLEELDVDPDLGRQGIGRRLLNAACDLARESGATSITLSTFRDVAWNAPFYARNGFEPIPPEMYTDAMRALREHEAGEGLAPERRILMRRSL